MGEKDDSSVTGLVNISSAYEVQVLLGQVRIQGQNADDADASSFNPEIVLCFSPDIFTFCILQPLLEHYFQASNHCRLLVFMHN